MSWEKHHPIPQLTNSAALLSQREMADPEADPVHSRFRNIDAAVILKNTAPNKADQSVIG